MFLFHFGSRTFICAYTFFVSLPPSPVLNSFPMLCQQFDLAVSPFFFYWRSEFCFVYEAFVLMFHYSALHFRAEWRNVTFNIVTASMTMHNGASLMSSDPNGLLMPSGQMVSIEVWSNPNLIQRWDKPSSRWKGSAFEIGSETWSSGRIEVSVVFCVFSLFAFRLRFLDLISNKWKSLKNV